MSKKLKTTILISSVILVIFVVGLLAVSMLGNVSSIEIYDFRVMEMPSQVSDVNEDEETVYEIYLTAQSSQNSVDLSSIYHKTNLVSYSFVSSDAEVAEVKAEVNGYFLYGKQIGVTKISVTKTTSSEDLEDLTEIIEPVEGFTCVVYRELTSCDMYLTTPENNFKEITIKSLATNSNFGVTFSSTDSSVAQVVRKDGKYYVNALSTGKATITAYCIGNERISDSFVVNVFDNKPNDLAFLDVEGAKTTQATIYDDGTYYDVYYKLTAPNEEEKINASNIKITSISTEAINVSGWYESTLVDPTKQLAPFDSQDNNSGAGVILDINECCIKIKKSNVSFTSNNQAHALGFITLSTYLIDELGNEVITGNYTLTVNIYHKVEVGKELEVSFSPEFSESVKNIYNYSGIAWRRIKTADNSYTTIDKDNFSVNVINLLYFNPSIKTIYVRGWTVYNNGDRDPTSASSSTQDQVDILYAPDSSYGVISVKEEVISNSLITSVTCDVYGINVEIRKLADITDFKSTLYVENSGIYLFNYWDYRFRLIAGEKTDENGKVIGFN